MADTSMICAGIDVSKTKLDIALHPAGAHLSVGYDEAGLKRLDAFLAEHRVERVGFESSGGYDWRLLLHLRAAGVPGGRFPAGPGAPFCQEPAQAGQERQARRGADRRLHGQP